jgi:hypothetical protein
MTMRCGWPSSGWQSSTVGMAIARSSGLRHWFEQPMDDELLHVEGWPLSADLRCKSPAGQWVNHKKVERLWREEGLQLPQRHRKRRRLYHKDSSIIRLRPTHPNHVWAIHCPAGDYGAICREGTSFTTS